MWGTVEIGRGRDEEPRRRRSEGKPERFIGSPVRRVAGRLNPLRWTPKVGQAGSLAQTRENDPHVQETTSA
jgi:hypothetical protein